MQEKTFDIVILSGGGSKAIVHLGALDSYYEDAKYVPNKVEEYRGTSAGAVISLLLVCGYTPMEIFNYVYKLDNFLGAIAKNSTIWEVINKKGLMPIDRILCHLDDLIEAKIGYIPTLKELYDLTKINLIMPTVNVTLKKKEYLSHRTHPDLDVSLAAKMSSNLPLIFQEIVYKNNYYLDGGLVDNFPSENIDPSKKVLGVIVTGTDAEGTEMSFLNYIYRAMMFPVNTMTLLRAENLGKNFTIIKMTVNDVPVLEIQMSKDRKEALFMKGYASAKCEASKELLKVNGWGDYDFDAKEDDDFGSWDIDIKV